MKPMSSPQAELDRRIPYRVYGVQNAGVLTHLDAKEVAAVLTRVHPRIIKLLVEFPEFAWGLLDHVVYLSLTGVPDGDDSGNWIDDEEKALNDKLTVDLEFDPLIEMKRYRNYYNSLVFSQDMLSHFRYFAFVLNKFKPRDLIAEVKFAIAKYFAQELVKLGMEVPEDIVNIVGPNEIEEIKKLESELDKVDITPYMSEAEMNKILEEQLYVREIMEQRLNFGNFIKACGEPEELAVLILNLQTDPA